jgi:hypothetical protein
VQILLEYRYLFRYKDWQLTRELDPDDRPD